jgi:hypothetical protein
MDCILDTEGHVPFLFQSIIPALLHSDSSSLTYNFTEVLEML